VKVEPKSIGVGQYQHDVHQALLDKKLDEVVESCVNQVGVELNTASAPLLALRRGHRQALAKKIVAHRDLTGAFKGRRELLEVRASARDLRAGRGLLRVRGARAPARRERGAPRALRAGRAIAADLGVPVTSSSATTR
jgi:protein Tex